jgi:glycosyltransferase involved in cell wall biosynthesis
MVWPPRVLPDGADQPPAYLCFSGQDWWYHNQSHSDFQLMRLIAKRRKVLLVNSIGLRIPRPGKSTQPMRRIARKAASVAKLVRRPIPETPGFHVMTPLPLPLYSRPWQRTLNAALVRAQVSVVCRALGIDAPVIVVTIPTAWDIVASMDCRSLLFNHSDRHSAFIEADSRAIEQLEQQLLRNADHVLYVSRELMSEESDIVGERGYFLDHGVDLEHFTRGAALPSDIATIPSPRVGFFGALDESVVDFELLELVASAIPNASLVLIGVADSPMTRLTKYPNVHWMGARPYDQIPHYGAAFDVALMPWLDNEWIRYANPIKLKEYLALGLAVVSTDFPEVRYYRDQVAIATSHSEFVRLVRDALHQGGVSDQMRRRESVNCKSWESRASRLVELAEER